MTSIERRIRERAYRLWIEEGQPDGRADRHWEEARRRIEAEGETETCGPPIAAGPAATAVLHGGSRRR